MAREQVSVRTSDLPHCRLPATGHKCARCWNFMPEVANYGIWENVCTRCQDALKEMKIAHHDPRRPPNEIHRPRRLPWLLLISAVGHLS